MSSLQSSLSACSAGCACCPAAGASSSSLLSSKRFFVPCHLAPATCKHCPAFLHFARCSAALGALSIDRHHHEVSAIDFVRQLFSWCESLPP